MRRLSGHGTEGQNMAGQTDKRSIGYVLRREIFGKYQYQVLKKVKGIIHVGANIGQERDRYAAHGLSVAWIEPIDDVFVRLQENITGYKKQAAYRYLVADKDNEVHTFNVASNDGSSSSILELGQHKDIFPDIGYVRSFKMPSTTLTTLVEREQIEMNQFDMLVMDTQGSELLVLKGADHLLPYFQHIQTEAADFEAYKGCCRVADLEDYLLPHGFVECHRKRIMVHPDGGQYFEIIYGRSPLTIREQLMV
jgi:FkbM family methyltransferase